MFLAGLANDGMRLACGLVHAFITTFTFILPFSLIRRVSISELGKDLAKGGHYIPTITKVVTKLSMSVTKGVRCIICDGVVP